MYIGKDAQMFDFTYFTIRHGLLKLMTYISTLSFLNRQLLYIGGRCSKDLSLVNRKGNVYPVSVVEPQR